MGVVEVELDRPLPRGKHSGERCAAGRRYIPKGCLPKDLAQRQLRSTQQCKSVVNGVRNRRAHQVRTFLA
jgi:hypothetical protein